MSIINTQAQGRGERGDTMYMYEWGEGYNAQYTVWLLHVHVYSIESDMN